MKIFVYGFLSLMSFSASAQTDFFLEAQVLNYLNPVHKQLFVSKIIEKIPDVKFDILEIPQSAEQAVAFQKHRKAITENPTFDIGLVSFITFEEILKKTSQYTPVGELAFEKTGPACSFQINTFVLVGKKVPAEGKGKLMALKQHESIITKWAAKEKITDVKMVRGRKDVLKGLKEGLADFTATASQNGGGSPLIHYLESEVKSGILKLVKTHSTDIPCALLVRKKSGAKIEDKFANATKSLDRRFLLLETKRQKQILDHLNK